MTAPSLRLSLEVRDDGAGKPLLQARWVGPYVNAGPPYHANDLAKLAAQFHRALELAEQEAERGRVRAGEDSSAKYVEKLGVSLAAKLGLNYSTDGLPDGPGLLELETCGATDALPLEILPWRGGPMGRRACVSRSVRMEAGDGFKAMHAGGFKRALIVAGARTTPFLQLESECEMIHAVFSELGIRASVWHVADEQSEQEAIEELRRRMGEADILHIAGHVEWQDGGGWRFQLDGARQLYVTPEELCAGERIPRLVWMNTCHSAEGGHPGCFAARFLTGGTLAFVGTGARLEDIYIRHACRRFYAEALRGTCLVEALRQARCRLHDLNSTTWSVLRLYGQGHLVVSA